MIVRARVKLRKKHLADARNDYKWQTDVELARLDAQPLVTVFFSQFMACYASQLRELAPKKRFFAVETSDGSHIGNCTYYNVDRKKGEAEVGIMIGEKDYWGRGYGSEALQALVKHIFRRTKLDRLYLKTLDWNLRAQRCFAKCGFIPCGKMNRDSYNFAIMELSRSQWRKQQ
ncbi:GNAT family N-acetyltransferase, partial [Chloroflexota bacterium]